MTSLPRPVSVYKVTQVSTQLGTQGFQSDCQSVRQQGGLVIGEKVQGQQFYHLKSWCEFISQGCILSQRP